MENKILRVKGSTNPISLASTIAHSVYAGEDVTLRAIGPGPVNQAVKGVIIAQSYVGAKGKRLSIIPGFADVEMEDGIVSAVVLRVLAE
jgi:stage V sporulation protein S